MKTLRFFGMALLTVLMSVSFSACGDDDSSDGDSPSNNKHLVKVTKEAGNNTSCYEYTYDSNGRVVKVVNKLNGNNSYHITYTYTDNLIVQKRYYGNSSVEHSHTLENGLIVSGENDKYRQYQYTYENGHLTSAKEGNNVYSYIWENDNIIRIDYNGEVYKKYEYTNYAAPQGFITPSGVEDDLGLFYGKSSKNLPSKYTSYDEHEGRESTYDWALKDGLPVHLIEMEKDGGGTYTIITTFDWE